MVEILSETKDLNMRVKTIKLLEENIGGKFYDNNFLGMTPKAQMTKKIGSWDLKILNFHCVDSTLSTKQKGNPWKGRKYLQVIYVIRV